ncbi:DUF4166 domain-containing protein [Stenotrophomonas rhizophila]
MEFTPEAGGERWTRTFAGRRFSSLQTQGQGRNEALLVERFGVISVALALLVDNGRLQLVPRRWSLLGMPLPQWLLPGKTVSRVMRTDALSSTWRSARQWWGGSCITEGTLRGG